MPRKFPTKQLGVYGKYDLNPEKAVTLFFESKHQNQFYSHKPSWDLPRDGFELAGVQNDRDLLLIEKEQEQMRKDAQVAGKINEKRVADINQVQESLRRQFIEVNEFIQDCKMKESEAQKKILIEEERQKQLTEEIEELTAEVKELNEFEEVLKEAVDKFKPYEEIVVEVVGQCEIFENVEDLMTKCDALLLAQVEITEMEQEKLKLVEEIRQKMVKATNEAAQVILNLDNELDELERSYDTVKQESLRWEKILATTKNYIAENEMVTNRLLNTINQLYRLLCKRNDDEPVFLRTEPEKELDYIKDEIEMLQKIAAVAKEKLAKEDSSTGAEKGTITKVKNAYLMKHQI